MMTGQSLWSIIEEAIARRHVRMGRSEGAKRSGHEVMGLTSAPHLSIPATNTHA
jgi:hypothetical protein